MAHIKPLVADKEADVTHEGPVRRHSQRIRLVPLSDLLETTPTGNSLRMAHTNKPVVADKKTDVSPGGPARQHFQRLRLVPLSDLMETTPTDNTLLFQRLHLTAARGEEEPVVAEMEANVSLGRPVRWRGDNLDLLENTPPGNTLRVCKPPTTPKSSSSSSVPRHKRARRISSSATNVEMTHINKPVAADMKVNVSPGGPVRRRGDESETAPHDNTSQVCKPPTTPKSSSSSSAPRHKRAGRSPCSAPSDEMSHTNKPVVADKDADVSPGGPVGQRILQIRLVRLSDSMESTLAGNTLRVCKPPTAPKSSSLSSAPRHKRARRSPSSATNDEAGARALVNSSSEDESDDDEDDEGDGDPFVDFRALRVTSRRLRDAIIDAEEGEQEGAGERAPRHKRARRNPTSATNDKMTHINKPVAADMEVNISPKGPVRRRGDESNLLETAPNDNTLQVCKPPTTPKSSSSSSAPRHKRAGRSPTSATSDEAGARALVNSSSEDESDDDEDDEGDGDPFVDFRALRVTSRRLRDAIIDAEEAEQEGAGERALRNKRARRNPTSATSNEMTHINKSVAADMKVNVSPEGPVCRRGDYSDLLETKPTDNTLRVGTPPTTPKLAASSSSSAPRNKRAGRKTTSASSDEAGARALVNSGSEDESDDDEDDDCDEDNFVDFRALRVTSRRLRDAIIDAEEVEQEGAGEDAREGAVGYNMLENERVPVDQGVETPVVDQMAGLDKFSWSEDFTTFSGQEETYQRTPGPLHASQDPLEVFLSIWDGGIINTIVEETNRYAWQKIAPLSEFEGGIPEYLSTWVDTTSDEMYRYFALLILMSICYRSDVREYWTTGFLEIPQFRKAMSRNRFMCLSKFLHFVNNDTIPITRTPYENKFYKIQPIVEHCNKKFCTLYTPNKHLSLDESLLLWKGRNSVQCVRNKVLRRGIKSYDLCEAETGYLLRTLFYAGRGSSMHPGPISGFNDCTSKVVLELMEGYLDIGHNLVMDNWYNQLPLTRFLKRRGTDVIGTMNRRRVHVPHDIKFANDTLLSRGDQIARHCGDISLVAWQDVTAVSTYHTDARVPTRRAGTIKMPKIIAAYNKFMGGVDGKDRKLSMFIMERKRGKKWYIKMFKRLLNTSILNAFIIYRKNPDAKVRTQREFRYQLGLGLLGRFPLPASIPTSTTPYVKTSDLPRDTRRLITNAPHNVAHTENVPGTKNRKPKRCVRCTAAGRRSMVTIMCTFCQAPLCAGTCWAEFHSLQNLR